MATSSHEVHTDNVLQMFHVNINCSDFDRSLAFYKMLGFRELVDFSATPAGRPRSFGEKGLGPVLNLPADCDGRAALLTLGDDPRATRLDLIEWKTPKPQRRRPTDLAQLGIARLCLKVRDCEALYKRLVTGGYIVYSAPTLIELAGTREYVFCCEDPDGTVLEFMQFVRSPRAAT